MSGPDLKGLLNGAANGWLTRRAYTDRMRREAKREGWWWLRERGRALSRGVPLVAGWSVVWPNLGRAELVPLEIAAAGPGDVTIEIAASVVSPGTERAQYLGLANTSIEFPGRPGYSAAGVVRRVGRGVSGLRPGDLVATAAAAHASVATVPADRVHRVPAGVDAPAAATVGLGVIAALGVRRARIAPGERACVVGAGPIGLLAQRLAAAAGAGECVVVATTRRREEAVVRGGARLVPAGDRDALQALGCPVVIEATGDAAALSTAIAAAGPGGRVVLLGSARGGTAELALADLQTRGIRLVGAHIDLLALESRRSGADAHRAEAQGYLRALADGAVTVDDLVAEGVDPREADAYYRRLGHGRTTAIRFAWDALPAAMRPRRGRLTRLPDVGARGIEPGRGRLATRADDGPFALPDPFAGAEGDLRLGFIGCGDIALQNAAAAASAPNVSPVACYDPVRPLAEDLARRFGMRVAATSEALLAGEDIDAVVIATPHHLHAPLALQAIAAGAHVIVEKPMAERLAPAREMVDAAERAGVVLTTMFVARYEPRAMVARRLIAAGAIGAPRGLSLTFLTDKPLSYWHAGASGRARSSWRGVRELAGGGVLIMNLCHCLDLARWLLQDDGERVLAADASATERPGVEDMVALTVRYRGGALGSFVGACDVPGVWEERPATDFHLWGSEGHLLLEPEPALYTRIALDGLRSSRWHGFPPMPRLSQRALFLSRLATSLARGEPPEVTAAEALAVQEIIEEAYGSAGLVPPVGVDAREPVRP